MEFPGKKITEALQKSLKKEVLKLNKKKPIKLVVFLVQDSPDQASFVKIKGKIAKKIGIEYEVIRYKAIPSFEEFMHQIKSKSMDPTVTGIIIQQPLPAQLLTASIYDYIPLKKEIEGHKYKTPFLPPIGLAILTTLKYFYSHKKIDKNLFFDVAKDKGFIKKTLRNKKIVIVGRGTTGGQPIGKTLSETKINYISINSETPEPETYLKEADIVITAAGCKVINCSMLKPGVALINVGLRKENGRLKGDYDEKEIKHISSFYTPTPGGVGPIDVIYLYKNLIEAAKLQR